MKLQNEGKEGNFRRISIAYIRGRTWLCQGGADVKVHVKSIFMHVEALGR